MTSLTTKVKGCAELLQRDVNVSWEARDAILSFLILDQPWITYDQHDHYKIATKVDLFEPERTYLWTLILTMQAAT